MQQKLTLTLLPLSFVAGYWVAPKQQLATEVVQDGFFQVEEATVRPPPSKVSEPKAAS